MTKCLISFGANIPGPFGSPADTLNHALQEFHLESLLIENKSSFYSSLSFPDLQKPKYINGCLQISVNCEADDVLGRLKSIEKRMGRQQEYRWASRICDLDLLSFGNKVAPTPEIFNYWYKMQLKNQILKKPNQLLLPHPRIQDRAFVLKPLLEFAASWTHPVLHMTVTEMFNFLPEEQRDSVVLI